MLNVFAVVMRESLEAVLILALIIGFLKKKDLLDLGKKYLYSGVISGVLLSTLFAYAIYNLGDWIEGMALNYFELVLFFGSTALIVHMVFWMRKMGKNMKNMMETELDQTMGKMGMIGIAVVCSLAIAREGAETVVYLYSMSMSGMISVFTLSVTSAVALVVSVVLGITFIRGMGMFKLTTFFNITSIFLLITAGAFLNKGSSRLIESGLVDPIISPLWDSSQIISVNSSIGSFLTFFAGYVSQPSLIEVALYFTYWSLVIAIFMIQEKSSETKKNEHKYTCNIQPQKI